MQRTRSCADVHILCPSVDRKLSVIDRGLWFLRRVASGRDLFVLRGGAFLGP